jgi:hypothetical protein
VDRIVLDAYEAEQAPGQPIGGRLKRMGMLILLVVWKALSEGRRGDPLRLPPHDFQTLGKVGLKEGQRK